MILGKFTFTYEEKASHNYQSSGVILSVEVTPEEGDTYEDAYKKTRDIVYKQVHGTVQQSIDKALEAKEQREERWPSQDRNSGYRRS